MNLKSILLVEDDECDVISLQRVLKKMDKGISLFTAYNGIEALELLKGENKIPLPDVILLDLNMPKMNGIEFLTEIRKDTLFDKIRIYIMTAFNSEDDRINTQKLGVAGYMIKPLNFNENTKRNSSMDYFKHFQIAKILRSDNG